jgi:hypothetical protein
MIEDWRSQLDKKNDVISVFLDLSKAFDTVDHKLLLHKLTFYNFDDLSINLIKNYLSNRSIKVNVNGSLSFAQPLRIGVPQGSVLGPLLFIIFINDFCFLKLNSKPIIFADDTTISSSGETPELIIKCLEEDLVLISNWLKHNNLILNVHKSQAMYLSSNQRLLKTTQEEYDKLTISCGTTKIKFSREVKILGVIVDNKLAFGSQTSNICSKVNSKAYLLNKSLYLFTENFKPTLFKVFIQSQFDYCSSLIIHRSDKSHVKRLNTCFAKSIHRILKIKIHSLDLSLQFHMLQRFKIVPLELRHFSRFCIFLFNILSIKNSELARDILLRKNNTQTRTKFREYNWKKNFKKFSFSNISIKLLNSFLADRLEAVDNINIRKFLNTSLLKLYMDSVEFWT